MALPGPRSQPGQVPAPRPAAPRPPPRSVLQPGLGAEPGKRRGSANGTTRVERQARHRVAAGPREGGREGAGGGEVASGARRRIGVGVGRVLHEKPKKTV